MVTIGYLHYRKEPVNLNKAYAFAAVAKAEGAEILYFSPGSVNLTKRKIKGYMYQNGQWVKTVSEFPDVVYNAVGFSKEKQDTIVSKLMDEIPFTSHSIGSKMTVFNNLTRYGEFTEHLIPTIKIRSAEHFFSLLDKYENIVFKPSFGCQGIDVYRIKKADGAFDILSGEIEMRLDLLEVNAFIEGKIDQDFIVQPYINSRTKSGYPYDIRLHTQKTGNGEWVAVKIYPRISVTNSIVCNISSGGYTAIPDIFFKQEFGDEYATLMEQINLFAKSLSEHIDNIQCELYKEELNELGIDIGIDENRKICIYEVNWRPGYPPSMNIDFSVIKNHIHFAISLAARRQNT